MDAGTSAAGLDTAADYEQAAPEKTELPVFQRLIS